MSLAVIYSRAQLGIQAPLVFVEVHLSNGLPALSIVGLPETAVRESKDRVRSALLNSGFEFPARRITINLAPAELPKQGGRYDLAIALGILAASGQVPLEPLPTYEFVAELALSGATRPVHGVLSSAMAAKESGRQLICAPGNCHEASLGGPDSVRSAAHLLDACRQLHEPATLSVAAPPELQFSAAEIPDLRDVSGQQQARRALEVAAAGAHNLLFSGPPGTGKTLLASRLPGILPELSDGEALEAASVASVSSAGFSPQHWKQRPFRAPHHTASAVALVGGGSTPRPGEISLAHQGVLFLDELPEFQRQALETLREPMETGYVTISRAACQTVFPASFQLVATMNPCPCGFLGDPNGRCRCTADQIQRYRQRISGPLLDRIDLQVNMLRVPWRQLEAPASEASATVRQRVLQARDRQASRGTLNARLPTEKIHAHCSLDQNQRNLLEKAVQHFCLSPRAVHGILKVSRTIADLAGEQHVGNLHLQEAIGYRCTEKTAAPA